MHRLSFMISPCFFHSLTSLFKLFIHLKLLRLLGLVRMALAQLCANELHLYLLAYQCRLSLAYQSSPFQTLVSSLKSNSVQFSFYLQLPSFCRGKIAVYPLGYLYFNHEIKFFIKNFFMYITIRL